MLSLKKHVRGVSANLIGRSNASPPPPKTRACVTDRFPRRNYLDGSVSVSCWMSAISYLLSSHPGVIKSWQRRVRQRFLGPGTEMTWWKEWLNQWPLRAWGPSAWLTGTFLPLKVNQTGITRMISWPGSSVCVSWALKTQLDQRYKP